jgi:hypothetical protein
MSLVSDSLLFELPRLIDRVVALGRGDDSRGRQDETVKEEGTGKEARS